MTELRTIQDIKDMILSYVPQNDQEAAERESFKQFLEAFGSHVLARENLVGHLTVSCWIINSDFSKVLMVHHNLYQTWAWIGGHADNNSNLFDVARKETLEETGVERLELLSPFPIDLNVLTVHEHYKNNHFVPAHLHYNIVFAFKTDENQSLRHKADENSAVQWIKLQDIDMRCQNDIALPYYHRIIKKLKKAVD